MREKNFRPDRILGSSRKPPSSANSNKKSSSSSSSSKGSKKGQQSSNTRPTTSTRHNEEEGEEDATTKEERARQQALLDVFGRTFASVLGARDFGAQLQELKAALFARDFEAAFAREAALDVYAARWSPTRALCYGRILRGLAAHLRDGDEIESSEPRPRRRRGSSAKPKPKERRAGDEEIEGDDTGKSNRNDVSEIQDGMRTVKLEKERHEAPTSEPESKSSAETPSPEEKEGPPPLRVLAIGGAAAEIVAFADYVSDSGTSADVTLLDVGPWGSVVERLHMSLLKEPESAPTATSSSLSLVTATSLKVEFVQKDILSVGQDDIKQLLRGRASTALPTTKPTGNTPVLITLLFTLNELYTTGGIKLTTTFLRSLTAAMEPGTLLLVVDSPGSYSEAAVGKEARKYPMQWLLDHTLLKGTSRQPQQQQQQEQEESGEKKQEQATVGWKKIESSDSTWYRLPEGLRYPIQLENMRYQLHLYRYESCA